MEKGNSNNNASETSPIRYLKDMLSSIKLGITLLLMLGCASAYGTFLTGSQEFYKTYFFRFLLIALALNISVCTFSRLGKILSSVNRQPVLLKGSIPSSLTLVESFVLTGRLETVTEAVNTILLHCRFRMAENSNGGRHSIAATKNNWGLLGSPLTHLGFLVILVGVLVGSIWGSSGSVNVMVGDSFNVADVVGKGAFSLRVDDFHVQQYSDGQPSQYISKVSVTNNASSNSYYISVNSPLTYQGIKFYQASWGSMLKLKLSGPSGETIVPTSVGEVVAVPGTDYKLYVYNFMEEDKKLVYSIYKGNSRTNVGAVGADQEVSIAQGISFAFIGIVQFTGLQVKTDPGVPVVWIGCGMLLTGILISLYVRPKFLWLLISSDGEKVYVEMAGRSYRNSQAFNADFSRIAGRIKLSGESGEIYNDGI